MGGQASIATPRYARKKEAILAAATAILNRQGVKGMTLADVAAEVGLITTSVTYYYRKKDDLAAACFRRGIEVFEGLVLQAAEAPDWESRLTRFIDSFVDLGRKVRLKQAPPLVSFTEMRALKEPHRSQVIEAFAGLFRKVRGLFDTPEFEHLDKLERSARTHLLLEQAFWVLGWVRRYDLEDYPRVRRRMLDILMGGLAAEGRVWNPAALPPLTPGDPDDARETFLIAATRLINQRGYRGASVEDISAELNVTKGSFYHHNTDKDALVADCYKRSLTVMRRAQLSTRDLPGEHWDKLASATAALVDYQRADDGPLLRASAMSALPQPIRQEMAERYARVSDRFAAMISDGIAEGSIRPVDPMIAAHMLGALINAASSLDSWVPGVERREAAALLARPLLMGVFTP